MAIGKGIELKPKRNGNFRLNSSGLSIKHKKNKSSKANKAKRQISHPV